MTDLLSIPSGVLAHMVATVEGAGQELRRRAYARATERLRPALERVPGRLMEGSHGAPVEIQAGVRAPG